MMFDTFQAYDVQEPEGSVAKKENALDGLKGSNFI